MKKSFISKFILKLLLYSSFLYLLFCIVLTFVYVNLENEKYEILSDQTATTLKPLAMVKDEIAIRRYLDTFIDKTHIVSLSVKLSGNEIKDSLNNIEYDKSSNSFLGILFSNYLEYKKSYRLYPNSNERFQVSFIYKNTARASVLIWALIISVMGIFCAIFIFYKESAKMISFEFHKAELDSEKSKLAARIFHQIKSDAQQIENLIEAEKNNISLQNKILLRGIGNTILKGAQRFIKSDKKLLDESELVSNEAEKIVLDMVKRKSLEFGVANDLISYDLNGFGKYKVTVNYENILAAFSELINNSYDSINENKRNGKIKLTLEVKESLLSFILIDNGCGVPENKIQEIFVEGFSINKTNGNGLGLTHAKELINSMGGEIELFSNEGVGTTVKVSFFTSKQYENTIQEKLDAVYIDDSLMSLLNVKKKASLKGKSIATFTSFDEYFELLENGKISNEIPLFTDSDLGQEFFGEEYARKAFDIYGVENIHIVTGDPEKFHDSHMFWIKKIVIKDGMQDFLE